VKVRVKICGVTRAEDAEAAVAFGADFIGLNFYRPSPRSILPQAAQPIRDLIGNRCGVVGVFVNADRSYVDECRKYLRLDYLQFHGDEQDDALRGWTVPVIRALRLWKDAPLSVCLDNHADYVLIDAAAPGLYGGTGRALALDRLDGMDLGRVFIAGGLTAENVGAAVRRAPFAVDTASGVESAPGIKDHAKLRSFIANAKSAG
jgi:phosphoribosylanthranilate isomerase